MVSTYGFFFVFLDDLFDALRQPGQNYYFITELLQDKTKEFLHVKLADTVNFDIHVVMTRQVNALFY